MVLVCMTLMIASCGKSDDSSTLPVVYTVTYNGNGNTGGNAPSDSTNYQQGQTVTVLGNTGNLVQTYYSFVGWNTQASGSGTTYTQGQTFTMGAANVTLYAMWTKNNTTYTVEYVPGTGMNAPTEGKSTFQLKITKTSDGSPAGGLTPTLSLLMTMTSGEQHATPIDIVSESSTTPGTYDCTVYYLMASGATMGTWEMDVTVNGETTKFNPDVAMSMKSDTVRATLKGQNDIISSMTGTEKRSYYIFNDGLASGMGMGSGTLSLFIAAKESMMSFPSLVSKSVSTTKLHDETGASWSADPVTVDGSLDGTSWTAGTNTKGGHWSISLMSGITSSVTNTFYVRLSVGKNGGVAEQKTTDGNAASGSNGYQTILVTPSSM
jgi:uncharacterized repeat protein (TIGR02543 family)